MLKSYRIDGSAGEISNRLEDKIQESRKTALREISFEELTNFIPKKDFLAETINGVKLEYLLKNQPSKSFVLEINQETAILHIFQDKIITTFPLFANVKIFVDVIPSDILVDVESISSCFKVVEKAEVKIIFNSTAGIYFVTVGKNKPIIISSGSSYFTKIWVPESLKGSEINFTTGDVYSYLEADGNLHSSCWSIKALYSGINEVLHTETQTYDPQYRFRAYFYIDILSLGKPVLIGDIIKVSDPYNLTNNVILKIVATKKLYTYIENGVKKISEYNNFNNADKNIVFAKPININTNYTLIGRGVTYQEKDFYLCSVVNSTKSIDILNPWQVITPLTNNRPELRVINNLLSLKKFFSRYRQFEGRKNVTSWARIEGVSYDVNSLSYVNANAKINIISSSASEVKTFAPYTPFALNGRLAVSTLNTVKMSKIGEYDNLTINSPTKPLETDAFEVIFQDIGKITFISNWSSGAEKGFVFGTTKELLYFGTLTNIFNKEILDKKPIPCSYIPPLQFNISNITSNVIVQAGRTKILAIIPTKEQVSNVNLTQYVNFFDNDPIKKIQQISYDDDNLLFVLTDNGNLYGCLTGGSILSWFRIKLTYIVEDIASLDAELTKKLFLTSIIDGQSQKLVGSIDFTENANQIKAEYFVDNFTENENIFSEEFPKIINENSFMLKDNLTQEQKVLLTKPIVCRLTFHNQEIITTKINTKQSKTKRKITGTRISIRNSNNFTVKYIYNDTNKPVFEKNVFEFNKIDDNLNSPRVKEYIEILKPSPATDNVKISVETKANSISPLTIQSITFDTEYGNPK